MKLFWTALTLALVLPAAARTFTDNQGRTIEAELVGHSGDTVVISRGGKEFPVPVTNFSLDDQEYIRQWIEANPGSARFRFRYYADLDQVDQSQRDAPGGAYEDKLKTFGWEYEMIVSNLEVTPAKGIEIRYEIYINDYVDVVNNRFVGLAVGADKVAKIQTIAGTTGEIDIAAGGRFDFKREFDIHSYIDRDGGVTDEAASDKVIGVRLRVYKGDQIVGEFVEAEDDHLMDRTTWQDAPATEGRGPTERG